MSALKLIDISRKGPQTSSVNGPKWKEKQP